MFSEQVFFFKDILFVLVFYAQQILELVRSTGESRPKLQAVVLSFWMAAAVVDAAAAAAAAAAVVVAPAAAVAIAVAPAAVRAVCPMVLTRLTTLVMLFSFELLMLERYCSRGSPSLDN